MFANLRTIGFTVVLCAALLAGHARAHGDHDRHPTHDQKVTLLTFERAIEWGAASGPDGNRARAPREAAAGVSAAAAPLLTQLPFVQAQVGPRLSNNNVTPEVIVSIAQPFTWGDTAGIQKRVARATQKVQTTHTQSAALIDAERAAHAWLDLALADEVLTLRQDAATQATALLTLARARVAAGEGQPMEVALAETELADAHTLVIAAEGSHYTAEVGLAYALGLTADTHVDVDGELPPPPPSTDDGKASVHPDVLMAESRKDLALEQVEYVKLQQAPVVQLGVQYQREGTGDQILTAVATLPLPVARPWAFQEAQQRLAVETARAEANYVRAQNALEVAHARHEREHTQSQYEHLERKALPPLREAHRLALVRYSGGATDFTEVSLVRQRLLRAEEQRAEALANVHHAHVRARAIRGQLMPSLTR